MYSNHTKIIQDSSGVTIEAEATYHIESDPEARIVTVIRARLNGRELLSFFDIEWVDTDFYSDRYAILSEKVGRSWVAGMGERRSFHGGLYGHKLSKTEQVCALLVEMKLISKDYKIALK